LNYLRGLFRMIKSAKRLLQLAATILLLSVMTSAQIPQPRGLVNDFADKLSPAARQALENQLKDFFSKHRVEIAVVTIPFDRLQNNSIENYTRELARMWKNNPGHTNLEVVLLVAIKDKKTDGLYGGSTRLEVTNNLQKVLSDELAKDIIQGMREDLKSGQFDNAITKGVQNIFSALSQFYGVLPEVTGNRGTSVAPNSSGSSAQSSTNRYSGAPNNSSKQNTNSNDRSLWAWDVPVYLFAFLFLGFILSMLFGGFILRGIAKSTGNKQSNHRASRFVASGISSSDSTYRGANWNDTTGYSPFSSSSSSSSYSDSSNSSSDNSSSSYSDSSSSSSSSDFGSSSYSDSSSSSSSDSSSSSGGGATDNW
jgi:uncharacterized membrane protein YgcG